MKHEVLSKYIHILILRAVRCAPLMFDTLQIMLANLTSDTVYEVYVVGATKSRFNDSLIYWGAPSETRTVRLQHDCEKIQYMERLKKTRTGWSLSSGMVIGVASASFALLFSMMAFFIWR